FGSGVGVSAKRLIGVSSDGFAFCSGAGLVSGWGVSAFAGCSRLSGEKTLFSTVCTICGLESEPADFADELDDLDFDWSDLKPRKTKNATTRKKQKVRNAP